MDDEDQQHADELVMALLMLGIDKISESKLRYVFFKVGLIAPMILTEEMVRYHVCGRISRWPTEAEMGQVHKYIQQRAAGHFLRSMQELLGDACKPLGRG